MAIIKKANNLIKDISNNYTVISGNLTKTAERMNIEAYNDNFTLAGNKKIVVADKQSR